MFTRKEKCFSKFVIQKALVDMIILLLLLYFFKIVSCVWLKQWYLQLLSVFMFANITFYYFLFGVKTALLATEGMGYQYWVSMQCPQFGIYLTYRALRRKALSVGRILSVIRMKEVRSIGDSYQSENFLG